MNVIVGVRRGVNLGTVILSKTARLPNEREMGGSWLVHAQELELLQEIATKEPTAYLLCGKLQAVACHTCDVGTA